MGLSGARLFERRRLVVSMLALSCFVVILEQSHHADGYLFHSETHSKALIGKRETGDEEIVTEDDSSAAAAAAAASSSAASAGASASASAAAGAAAGAAVASASASSSSSSSSASASASASAMSRGSRGALTESKKKALKDKDDEDKSSGAEVGESGESKGALDDASGSGVDSDKKEGSRSGIDEDETDGDKKTTTTSKPRRRSKAKRAKKPKDDSEDEPSHGDKAKESEDEEHKETDEDGGAPKGESRSFGSLFSGLMKGNIGGKAKLGGSLGGGLLGGSASLEGGLSAGAEASAAGEASASGSGSGSAGASAKGSAGASAKGSADASAKGSAGAGLSGSLSLGGSASASLGGKPLVELSVKDKKSIKAVEKAGGEADAHGGAKLAIGVNATLGGGLLPKLPIRAHGSLKLNANSSLVGKAIDKIKTDLEVTGKALGGLRANASATLGKLLDPATGKVKPLEFKTKEELHEKEKVVKTVTAELEAIKATSTTKKPKLRQKPMTATSSKKPAAKSRQWQYNDPYHGGVVNHHEWNNQSSTTNDTTHFNQSNSSSGSSTITDYNRSRAHVHACSKCATKKPWPLWWPPAKRTTTTTTTTTTITPRWYPEPTKRQSGIEHPHYGGHVNHTVWNNTSSTTNNTSHFHTTNNSSGSSDYTHFGQHRVITPSPLNPTEPSYHGGPAPRATIPPHNPTVLGHGTQVPGCRREPSPCDYKELKESDKMLAVVVTKRGGFRGRRLSAHAIQDIMGHNLSQQEHKDLLARKTIELSVNNSFVLPAGTYYFPRAVRVVGFDLHT